jgi:hypothetical protein
MADETVNVALVSSNNTWVVTYPDPDGGDITIQAGDSDSINWVLQSGPDGAAITAVTIEPGQPGNLSWAGPAPTEANNFTTTDTDAVQQGAPAIAWNYSVTVTYDGVPYTSDPQITNDPPTINRTAPAAY